MTLSRRTFLAGSTAAGALLVAGTHGVLAAPLRGLDGTTSRASRLSPGTRLAHADLHNHTLYSDGAGNPAEAFSSMRTAGLDIAALTDHATVGKALPGEVRELTCAGPEGCSLAGIDEDSWQVSRGLADDADTDGSFTAIRGFEWSSPTLGHMNVWFSETWIDVALTGGVVSGAGLGQFVHDVPGLGPVLSGPLDDAVRALPVTGVGMTLFHDWLKADPTRAVLGGGNDAIAGFNHPGREPGRFAFFQYDAALRDRVVSLEVFNRGEDYLFEGLEDGFASPIAECLDAGWRVGLTGVTDEHGTDWGFPDGKGRTGLWVGELTRAGVREAMEARRFFSTRLKGLRLDASLQGVRMGQVVPHRSGPVTLQLDVDRGVEWVGKELVVQVLQTGRPLPRVVAQERVVVGPVLSLTFPVSADDGGWLVVRLTDPEAEADSRATGEYASVGGAVAYTAPFFLDPAAAPAPAPGVPVPAAPAVPQAPGAGGSAAGAGGAGRAGTASGTGGLAATGGTGAAAVGAGALAAAAVLARLRERGAES